ncbi:hypothetical protein COCON_G00220600 [Conger conger]|uniref:Uncharacterized protein n=1 Tax=Conger conger TaxID=82655 RepID=A0A9Q1CW90_CONCO|nr:hypothetical protein COCON_G00220600 [Conger conger]
MQRGKTAGLQGMPHGPVCGTARLQSHSAGAGALAPHRSGVAHPAMPLSAQPPAPPCSAPGDPSVGHSHAH